MEQLVILLLIALISLINWLVKKSSELRKTRKLEKGAGRSEESLRGGQSSSPESQSEKNLRRFREALGLPEEAVPPAPPKRVEQTVPPPLPPSLPKAPAPARRVTHPIPAVPSRVAPVHEGHRFAEFPHRITKSLSPLRDAELNPSRIPELLSSSGGLRDAMVLSEILGPPKSLRAGEKELLK
jgi:hypothetical protein